MLAECTTTELCASPNLILVTRLTSWSSGFFLSDPGKKDKAEKAILLCSPSHLTDVCLACLVITEPGKGGGSATGEGSRKAVETTWMDTWEEGIRSPGARVTGSSKLLDVRAGNRIQVLNKSRVCS